MTETPPEGISAGAALARKLNLLLDAREAEGDKVTFNDVRDAMKKAGTPLSRGRWHYLRTGTGPDVERTELLKNLAVYFGVNESYLLDTDDKELPERVEAQLELLTTMREKRVRNFAARQLDGLSPEALRQIRNLIDERLESQSKSRTETE